MQTEKDGEVRMKEIIIEVPDDFGKTLKPERVNSEIKGELVRCKDCKHGEECVKPHKDYWCNLHDTYQYGDWFCADGERR